MGGIIIKKDRPGKVAYEETRNLLIDELSQIKEPHIGETLMNWIYKREGLYSGEYLFKYPDIIFEFKDGYGAGWLVYDSLIAPCRTYNIQPGSHKAGSPAFLVANSDRRPFKRDITLMDIAPTVLELLGVEGEFNFDGKSTFK